MSKSAKNILLNREGTEQTQRFIDALEPSSIKLNDFNLKEWMQFAYSFAKHINYFDVGDATIPTGDWSDFFKKNEELETFLSEVEEGGNITPHLALFVCFIWLMDFTKNRFNHLTKRHLDFYYKDILKIEKLPASPDKVYVLFELAKKATQEKISVETELDGGKDGSGQKLIYETLDEIVVNKTSIAQLKSVYNDYDNQKIKMADVANSYDGQGASFPTDEVQWWPFGYYEREKTETGKDKEYPELKDAKLGFAVSSPILKLQEGERYIQIDVKFKDAISSIKVAQLTENLEVWCTGEEGWIGPFNIVPQVKNGVGKQIYSTQQTNLSLKLVFNMPIDAGSIVSYNAELHGEFYNITDPVCRLLIKTEKFSGYQLYERLKGKEIENIAINVNVEEIKNIQLENDIGDLNADKPFYPFGTQPVKGSNFYINYPEIFGKKWKELKVEIKWKNKPDSFSAYYYAYLKKYNEKVVNRATSAVKPILKGTDFIVENDTYFKASIEIQDRGKWSNVLFENKETLSIFTNNSDKFHFTVKNNNYRTTLKKPLKVTLNQSFLHELFPKIYGLALSSDDKSALIPNVPYTPIVESITMSYTASAEMKINISESDYQNNKIKLFHEHPFGQSEEHPYLKSKLDFHFEQKKKALLVPTYNKGGRLYIGLNNAEPLQSISLLIQVLEGSGNPESEMFDEKEKVEWSILCHNQWKSLDSDYMIINKIDNFLKSGIVKFLVPKEVNKENSLFDSNLIWIKAESNKRYDAISKVLGVHVQAVKAEFFDNGNELSHLKNGLEAGAISKLVHRESSIKGISQPYSSYGGKPEESDLEYYRRISERLRHKNRAISIWDYEHIILQQFPIIHKVKCLNHTSEKSFLAPGSVYIVVIPDIINTNVFDIFQPKVSKTTLNKIQSYINQLNSNLVTALVRNPDYEKISVELKVKFHKGYDESYYLKMLNDDIIRLLSPWAFKETRKIKFEATLHHSTLAYYIERFEYVDYIEELKLKKEGVVSTSVSPSNPKSILVSVRQHDIKLSSKSCLK